MWAFLQICPQVIMALHSNVVSWYIRGYTLTIFLKILGSCLTGLPNIGNHGFRHTHATMLFEAGADAKEIQERLGHSSITITMDTYTHLTKNNKTSTVDKLISHLNF